MTVKRNSVEAAATSLRSMFSQIGVLVKMEVVEMEDFSPRLSAKDYEVSVSAWIADYNDAMSFYGILGEHAAKNHSAFLHPRYDALIWEAMRERDHVKRQGIYTKLEDIIRQEAPIVPLIHNDYNVIAAPEIKEINFHPLSIFHILNVRYRKPL